MRTDIKFSLHICYAYCAKNGQEAYFPTAQTSAPVTSTVLLTSCLDDVNLYTHNETQFTSWAVEL
jgi:hypothetical protein